MQPLSIHEAVLFSVIKITSVWNWQENIGTWFFVNHEWIIYLVTNKHVILNWIEKWTFEFVSGANWEPIIWGKYIHEFWNDFLSKWILHPEYDIAVMNVMNIILPLNGRIFFRSLTDINTPKDLYLFDVCEHVQFVWYPNGQWDDKNVIPIFRQWYTATPIYLDYDWTPSFLIDANAFPWSSWSPVLIIEVGAKTWKPTEPNKWYNINHGKPVFYLLWMLTESLYTDDEEEIKSSEVWKKMAITDIHHWLNLWIVIRADTIFNFIKSISK